jgi:RNA polymerase sigma-70 factor (ECF subfamily)
MSWFRPQRDPARQAFDAEVLPHLDTLYANALRLTRSQSDAEDLAQETVLRAFRFHDRFEPGSNMKAWLLRIQYNAFVNRYRRVTRERAVEKDGPDSTAGADVMSRDALRALTDPTGNALRPLVLRELEAALETLPEDQRTVVLLADLEELSYKEIAEVIGCPIGTVMSRLHRARRALRERLLEQAEHELGAGARGEQRAEASASEPAEPAAQTVSLEAYRQGRRR